MQNTLDDHPGDPLAEDVSINFRGKTLAGHEVPAREQPRTLQDLDISTVVVLEVVPQGLGADSARGNEGELEDHDRVGGQPGGAHRGECIDGEIKLPLDDELRPPLLFFIHKRTVCDAERQASAGARDGVKGKRNDLAARAPLHALVGPRAGCLLEVQGRHGDEANAVRKRQKRPAARNRNADYILNPEDGMIGR